MSDDSKEVIKLEVGKQEVSNLYVTGDRIPSVQISGQIQFRDQNGAIRFGDSSEAERLFNISMSTDEEARCLHRVVRAMHDGHCPSCGYLAPSDQFYMADPIHVNFTVYESGQTEIKAKSAGGPSHRCPQCGFTVTEEEAKAALEQFRTIMHRNCDVFLRWRERRKQAAAQPQPASATE